MILKIKSIPFIIILCMICHQALGQIEVERETRIIKGFLPIFENNMLSGFFMVASGAKHTYHITKCDVNLKVIASFEETHKTGDEVASMAFNNKTLCIVYASKGQNELVAYDPVKLTVLKRLVPPENSGLHEHRGAQFSKLYPIANQGFFFNKYTVDDKMVCHFIGLDNGFRHTWDFKSDLGFPNENVMPVSEKVESAKYFVNHIMRKKNVITPRNHNPSLLINNSQNGALVLHNNYDISEHILFIDYPEVCIDDSTDMAYLVGDYIHIDTRARGWVLSKMDLKAKTKVNTFIDFNSPDLRKFLDEEYQAMAAKNEIGFFPYAIKKFGEGFMVVGEIYAAKAKNIVDFDLTRPQDGYSQSVFFCELDKDMKVVALKYHDVADHKVNIEGKDSRYTTTFIGNILDARYDAGRKGLELTYYQELSDKQVEYCKMFYGEDRNIVVTLKKSFARKSANEQLNIFEGPKKFTVFRMDNGLLEIGQE